MQDLLHGNRIMSDIGSIDELKAAGAGRLATSEAVARYRQAFERFGPRLYGAARRASTRRWHR